MNVNHFLTTPSFNSITLPIFGVDNKSTHEKIVLYYLHEFWGENEHKHRLVCLRVNLQITPGQNLLGPTFLRDIKFESKFRDELHT